MGRKITIDSATMFNKALEIIEAFHLFELEADQIDVLVHPQSIVHSLVELIDGSIIAQLGITDMRLPIQYACSYPERWEARSLPTLDLMQAERLEFHAPARDRFPCLDLAYRALRTGGTLPVVLNAANEVAVERFLGGKLGFTAIPRVIKETMDSHELSDVTTLEVVRRVDRWSRECARHKAQALELNT
jgi:1-deoxy-D-xylulose-5-phosphate reductoisomerase